MVAVLLAVGSIWPSMGGTCKDKNSRLVFFMYVFNKKQLNRKSKQLKWDPL
jgi:hypothetical protein